MKRIIMDLEKTIEGVRLIKEKYPKTRSTLGISNVSFGLPDAGREVLNSVFLHHCVKAGLDTAIVNSEKLVRYSQVSEEEENFIMIYCGIEEMTL